MKKRFKIKNIIALFTIITIIVFIYIYLSIRLENSKVAKILDIPELENYYIVKGLTHENDSLITEFTTIINPSSEFLYFNVFKFRNVQNNFENLLQPDQNDFNGSLFNIQKININNAHEDANHIDFKYKYNNAPVSKTTSSDTLFIQKFEKAKLNISLDEKNKNDLVIRMGDPFTLVFYKKNSDLYLITAEQIDKDEKKWIEDQELRNIIYHLVKNWGIYDNLKGK